MRPCIGSIYTIFKIIIILLVKGGDTLPKLPNVPLEDVGGFGQYYLDPSSKWTFLIGR